MLQVKLSIWVLNSILMVQGLRKNPSGSFFTILLLLNQNFHPGAVIPFYHYFIKLRLLKNIGKIVELLLDGFFIRPCTIKM